MIFGLPRNRSVYSATKKVTALFAEAGNVNTAPASGQLAMFHHHALMAGGRKTIFDQIGKSAFQIKDRRACLPHLRDRSAAGSFFRFAQRQFFGIRIRRMEIERDSANIFRVPRCQAYIPHRILVDLIDCHIEADIIRGCIADILHDRIIGIAADLVMASPIAIPGSRGSDSPPADQEEMCRS